ncbi:hypothetical protein PsorP6_011229 [Peronosclerospora sorghi]|uniref:Uncharacterized protein n=1 Tax=Peronosclerospora sorghi TaxID=230839 RepID=A0ACC0VTW7_9STRA|nr:hypothetical protein PsorP6_011229 [Peronosclerospora sorghi]
MTVNATTVPIVQVCQRRDRLIRLVESIAAGDAHPAVAKSENYFRDMTCTYFRLIQKIAFYLEAAKTARERGIETLNRFRNSDHYTDVTVYLLRNKSLGAQKSPSIKLYGVQLATRTEQNELHKRLEMIDTRLTSKMENGSQCSCKKVKLKVLLLTFCCFLCCRNLAQILTFRPVATELSNQVKAY